MAELACGFTVEPEIQQKIPADTRLAAGRSGTGIQSRKSRRSTKAELLQQFSGHDLNRLHACHPVKVVDEKVDLSLTGRANIQPAGVRLQHHRNARQRRWHLLKMLFNHLLPDFTPYLSGNEFLLVGPHPGQLLSPADRRQQRPRNLAYRLAQHQIVTAAEVTRFSINGGIQQVPAGDPADFGFSGNTIQRPGFCSGEKFNQVFRQLTGKVEHGKRK